MEEQRQEAWISKELTDELAETAATLTRLGVTLAGLPLVLMGREQREQVRQVTDEIFRMGAVLPRTVTAMLQEAQGQPTGKRAREDLGSRLRRERAQQGGAPSGGEEPLEGETEATDEIEEEVQDAWNDPPLEPGEGGGS